MCTKEKNKEWKQKVKTTNIKKYDILEYMVKKGWMNESYKNCAMFVILPPTKKNLLSLLKFVHCGSGNSGNLCVVDKPTTIVWLCPNGGSLEWLCVFSCLCVVYVYLFCLWLEFLFTIVLLYSRDDSFTKIGKWKTISWWNVPLWIF